MNNRLWDGSEWAHGNGEFLATASPMSSRTKRGKTRRETTRCSPYQSTPNQIALHDCWLYTLAPPDPKRCIVFDEATGPPRAWNAGPDGRLVLDPLCRTAPRLMAAGVTLLLVHSETAGIERSLTSLAAGGLHAEVDARQRIPLGPVMSARHSWLQRTGRLPADHHDEELVVIHAHKQ